MEERKIIVNKCDFEKDINVPSKRLHGNRKDLTGLKVGKLTCLKPVKTGKNKHSEWLCECECGNFKIAQTYRLLSGRIQSCGDCYHTINHYIPMIKELEKQLKVKEQECEELKKTNEEKNELLAKLGCPTIATARMKTFTLEQQLDQLKAENEELKNFHINLVGVKECEIKELLKLKAENEKLDTENKRLVAELANPVFDSFEELDQLKQTLAEIKEICKTNVCKHCHSKFKVDDNYCKNIKDCDCYKILQKISEVIDER